jgi:hypothetical protein
MKKKTQVPARIIEACKTPAQRAAIQEAFALKYEYFKACPGMDDATCEEIQRITWNDILIDLFGHQAFAS